MGVIAGSLGKLHEGVRVLMGNGSRETALRHLRCQEQQEVWGTGWSDVTCALSDKFRGLETSCLIGWNTPRFWGQVQLTY